MSNRSRGVPRSVVVGVGSLSVVLVLGGCSSSSTDTPAGEWAPSGSVELMVPGSAGGVSDLLTRRLESTLSNMGVTAVVRNYSVSVECYLQLDSMAGDPDRLLTSNYGGGVLTPIAQSLDYSWENFTPIAMIGEDFSFVVTGSDTGLNTFQDVLDQAASASVTVGQVQSTGQNAQLTDQLEQAIGTRLEPVVFDGGGQQLAATVAGDVDISLMEPGEFIDQLEAGQVRALVSLGNRSDDERIKDVPAAEEFDITTNFVSQWRGFFAARDITDEQRLWWENAVRQFTDSEDYQSFVSDSLMAPNLLVGAEFEEFLRESVALAESSQS